jgi:flagellar protein FliS
MTANEAYNTYKNVLISTTIDKMQIVSLLYEGALGFAKKAYQAMQEQDEETKTDSLNRVSGILLALRDSLDRSADKETVDYLEALYNFLITKTLDANEKDNYEEFGIVIRYLDKMAEIWNKDIMKKDETA